MFFSFRLKNDDLPCIVCGVFYRIKCVRKKDMTMKFTSTRSLQSLESSGVITRGIAADGGLFVPESFPVLTEDLVKKLIPMTYKERAAEILKLYLTDFTQEEIARCVDGAYTDTFENNDPAPLKALDDRLHILELWHGPTCAFKDMALQILPYLLSISAKKTAAGKTMVILVATSGDTGKAALDGFADVEGTRIIVFFPQNGVSAMQKLQMTTQKGNNVAVCGIEGNFDDAQSGVKAIFADEKMRSSLAERSFEFSSANSINFGRLLPQIVYYVSAWCDLLKSGRIACGEKFNIAGPTGNFGNILAAYYARQMGVPVGKFICASNRNNVLSDFIRTGVYDRNRPFHTTTSPSMDILISSNLERLLYHLYNGDHKKIAALMDSLKKNGSYTIEPDVLEKLQADFYGGFCDDCQTSAEIGKMFKEYSYLCDTHTAVALHVYEQYVKETADNRPCVVASTASPFKFAPAVLSAVEEGSFEGDEFAVTEHLSAVSGLAMPEALASLKDQEVIHKSSIDKKDMAKFILDFLK